MQRVLLRLLCNALIVGLLTGPMLLAAQPPTQCSAGADSDAAAACSAGCCARHSDTGDSCCRKPVAAVEKVAAEGHCGSCPQGQCPCCDACHSLVIAVVQSPDGDACRQPPAARVCATEDRLISRGDEPLLPPPIV
jgi:hypothetical protein